MAKVKYYAKENKKVDAKTGAVIDEEDIVDGGDEPGGGSDEPGGDTPTPTPTPSGGDTPGGGGGDDSDTPGED